MHDVQKTHTDPVQIMTSTVQISCIPFSLMTFLLCMIYYCCLFLCVKALWQCRAGGDRTAETQQTNQTICCTPDVGCNTHCSCLSSEREKKSNVIVSNYSVISVDADFYENNLWKLLSVTFLPFIVQVQLKLLILFEFSHWVNSLALSALQMWLCLTLTRRVSSCTWHHSSRCFLKPFPWRPSRKWRCCPGRSRASPLPGWWQRNTIKSRLSSATPNRWDTHTHTVHTVRCIDNVWVLPVNTVCWQQCCCYYGCHLTLLWLIILVYTEK